VSLRKSPPSTPPLSRSGSVTSTPSVSRHGSPTTPSVTLKTAELQIGNTCFDPNSVGIRSQLLSVIGVPASSRIEELRSKLRRLERWCVGIAWVWQDLILKLVSSTRQESEKLGQLSRTHPSMLHDSMLSFPSQVVHCLGTNGLKRFDLIVMECAQGVRLGDFIGQKWYSGQTACVLRVLRKLGSCLHEFHSRYGHSQHGDFQPSNILYDEAADKITFIDVADIGSRNADAQHFLKSLKILSKAYGSKFLAEASQAFEAGYGR